MQDKIKAYYTVLRDSTMFMRAALTAGSTPPTKPIICEKIIDLYITSKVSVKLKAS